MFHVKKRFYIRFICLKNSNEFFMYTVYRFRLRKAGCTDECTHVYVWEHIVSLSFRTACWMFTKLGRDEVFMAPHASLGFSVISNQGWIQGGGK